MTYTRHLIKHGKSLAVIIPKKIVESLGLYKRQVMVIRFKRGRIDIVALKNNIDKGDKPDDS